MHPPYPFLLPHPSAFTRHLQRHTLASCSVFSMQCVGISQAYPPCTVPQGHLLSFDRLQTSCSLTRSIIAQPPPAAPHVQFLLYGYKGQMSGFFGSALVALNYWRKVREKTWESSPGQVLGGGGCPFYLRCTHLQCQSHCHKIPMPFQPPL